MRYGVAVLIAALLVFTGAGFQRVSGEDGISIVPYGEYCMVHLNNASYALSSGYPIIPYYVREYVLPFGSKVEGIDVKARDVEAIPLDKKIIPSPPARIMGEGGNEVMEGDIYSRDAFYPGTWYEFQVGAGLRNGKLSTIITLYLYPVQYNPARNVMEYAHHFDVNVDYETAKIPFASTDSYDLLIIAPDKWLDEVETLRLHKESHGVRTLVMGLNEIYSKYFGNDEQEDIKYAIKDALDRYGIKYVLLVGSADDIPVRYSYAYDGNEARFASDLYYADIYDGNGEFSSWDTNGNGYYAEYDHNGQRDDVDGYPDVYIGRLACSSDTDVKNVIQKIITYENLASGAEWMGKAVAFAGDSHDDNDGVYEGEVVKEKAFSYLPSFEREYIFTSDGTLSKASIKEKFSEGGALFNFEGHGNRMRWATHPPGDFDTWLGFDITDVASFSNNERTPVVILSACETGQFDKGTCLAWQLVRKSTGGGIATFAAAGLSWGYLGDYAPSGLSGYMDVLLCKNFKIGSHLGEMWGNSISTYIMTQRLNDAIQYKTIEEWTLFGDPSLMIGGYSSTNPIVYLNKPSDGYLYFGDREIMPTLFGKTIILGKITIEAAAYNVEKVEFYVDGELKYVDEEAPYEYLLDEMSFGSRTLKVVGYGEGEEVEDQKSALIFNI